MTEVGDFEALPRLCGEMPERVEHFLLMNGHRLLLPPLSENDRGIKEIMMDYAIHAYQRRNYEPQTTEVIRRSLMAGSVSVDVGASIGYLTLEMARWGSRVYSFEPTANQFPYLKANIRANGYEGKAFAFNLAAWDSYQNINSGIQVNPGGGRDIKGVVLDDILPAKVDFIKMDVDGSEPRALKGLRKTVENNPGLKMVVEYYPRYIENLGNDPKEMMEFLDKYFTYERIGGDYAQEDHWNYFCVRK